MLYRSIQLLARFELSFFHPSIQVRCVEGAQLEEEKPLIVVGNHIRGLPDILLIGATYRRKLWMLGNSSLPMFWGPFENVSPKVLPVLPVYRPDEGADAAKNFGVFDRGAELLGRGKGMLIFPSAHHPIRRSVESFKTGAARIAFAAMVESDWSIDLQIQPMGLNYSGFGEAPAVTIVVGAPVPVQPWRTRYEENPKKAVRELTRYLEERVRALTVQVQNEELDTVVEQIGEMFQIRNTDDHDRLSRTANALEKLEGSNPDQFHQIKMRVERYVSEARALHISAALESSPLRGIRGFLTAVLVIFGYLFHLVPLWVDRFTAHRVAAMTDPYYVHSARCIFALLIYPAWYILVATLGLAVGVPVSLTFALLAILAVLGWLTVRLFSRVVLFVLSKLMPHRIAACLEMGEELRRDLLRIEEAMKQAA